MGNGGGGGTKRILSTGLGDSVELAAAGTLEVAKELEAATEDANCIFTFIVPALTTTLSFACLHG